MPAVPLNPSTRIGSNGGVTLADVERTIRGRGETALRSLLEARDYAELLHQDIWQFALGLTDLCQDGLSLNDVRWLLYRQLIAHATETTSAGDEHRSFRPAGAIRFDRRSCFVLSEPGVEFARQGWGSTPQQSSVSAGFAADIAVESGNGYHRSKAVIPTWDRDRQELRLGDEIIKCFKTPAPNQELILAAFEEEGWPVHIDDPLPPHPEQDPRRRLHDTINSLNRNQKKSLLRFMGDGSGQGVRWELNRAANGAMTPASP
jgi:hypothetical protein